MIVMLDTSESLDVCREDLGPDVEVEQLLTPLTRRLPQEPEAHFAIDNGAYARFNETLFVNLLARHRDRMQLCRFVAVPDVVCDARRTLEVFEHWSRRPELKGWPLAFVAQNGQEHLPIPWDCISAIFIGGDTKWKLSRHAEACIKAAKALGKWAHVGRVNTPGRFDYCYDIGADSVDGTGLARFTGHRHKIHCNNSQHRFSFGNEMQ